MISEEDPWHPIPLPKEGSLISGRRVDANLPWNIFWAVDLERRCLLVLRHSKENQTAQKLPRLRGLEVELRSQADDGFSSLVLRLLDSRQRDLFYRLCLDIVSATENAGSETEAVGLFLARTWRWHRLLQVGRSGLLSEEEQKGLIGELRVLQRVLFPVVGIGSAIRAWRGPLGAPKDFEVGECCIESKSHRGAAAPYIEISSEHQLDTDGIQTLFVHVLEVATATSESHHAVTLTEAVASVVDEVKAKEPAHLDFLEERLSAAGFDFADDYSGSKWLIGSARAFEVREDFPRVMASDVRTGVHKVRYRIALSDCKRYELLLEDLGHRLEEIAE